MDTDKKLESFVPLEICLPEIGPKIWKKLEIISKIGPKSNQNGAKSGLWPDFDRYSKDFGPILETISEFFQIFGLISGRQISWGSKSPV